MNTTPSATRPHYLILDGLRGVAALLVICYHIFEGFATSPLDQKFNHGYLAVDFFFLLSGFVVGYAYDARLRSGGMTTREFLLRRFVRLHPMVVLAAVVGLVAFLAVGCERWDGTTTPIGMVLLATLMTALMIPAAPSAGVDVRGNGELFSLNGPAWSLFFEYVGNIIYVFALRHLSTRWLRVVVVLLGLGVAGWTLGPLSDGGSIGVGWTMADGGLWGGLLRMTFSFSFGLLLVRNFKAWSGCRHSFLLCSLALVVLLSMPRIGGAERVWLNGLYELLCVAVLFPLIVLAGASGEVERGGRKVCSLLGELSYPLYIIHYPLMYVFYRWVWNGGYDFEQAWPVALAVVAGSIVLAVAAYKFYDLPLRTRLSERLKHRRAKE